MVIMGFVFNVAEFVLKVEKFVIKGAGVGFRGLEFALQVKIMKRRLWRL